MISINDTANNTNGVVPLKIDRWIYVPNSKIIMATYGLAFWQQEKETDHMRSLLRILYSYSFPCGNVQDFNLSVFKILTSI